MVQRDRPTRWQLFHSNVSLMIVILLLGNLVGCAQSPPDQAVVKTFLRSVVQHIEEHSKSGFSEAEIYLIILSQIPDEAVYEFGDRTCETLRRGGSMKQIVDAVQARFSRDDERMTYLHIAQAAEKTLCPTSSFPVEGWQQSLFFWIERFNGGKPLQD